MSEQRSCRDNTATTSSRKSREQVEEGDWVKMCMQCGVCAGSCPLGPAWEHPPQELFMMIRAGKREEVLTSDSMWMCTSCYNCIVRCPRKLPITHIMHGLAELRAPPRPGAEDAADAPSSALFWNNCTKTGRVNELKLSMGLYFKDGFVQGIKNGMNDAGGRPRPGEGQAPESDGTVRRPRVQGSEGHPGHAGKRRAKSSDRSKASPRWRADGETQMAKNEYAFYPGCSSQKGASASNYLTSVESMCKTLDVKLTEIPDWNCCGASIGYAEARRTAAPCAESRATSRCPKSTCRARRWSPPAPPAGWAQRETKERLDALRVR